MNERCIIINLRKMKKLDSLEASYRCCAWVLWICVLLMIALWLTSCTTTRVVTVPEVHEVHHHHTDSVFKRDSVIDHKTTTIRELDSAAVAQYGIKLEKAERAWLIQTDRLQRELSELKEAKSDTVIQRDSVPYPVEVVKEVPRKSTWFERIMFCTGIVSILCLILFVAKKIEIFLP
jgi:hypothetical protein